MQHATKLVKPAEYARLRGLNRSTVSRQIRDGKIPVHGGLVDLAEADWARENNVDAKKRAGGLANRARVRRTPAGARDSSDAAHAAIVDTLRRIAAPAETLRFARMALLIGATDVQAYALGLWLSCQIVGPVDVEPEDVSDFQEPTQRDWKQLLGAGFDFTAGESAFEQIAAADMRTT